MSKFAIMCIALASVVSVSFAGQDTQIDLMRAFLLANFPEHDAIVGPWDDGEFPVRDFPGDFVNGILVGDFNSDGASDFAAKQARPLTTDEMEQIHPSVRDRMTTAEIVVVCDAQGEDSTAKDYRCYELVGQKIGGIHATLDFMGWEWVLGTLEEDDQPACQSAIKSRIGSKSLSLLEVHGHCDTFFYPNVDGGYHELHVLCRLKKDQLVLT